MVKTVCCSVYFSITQILYLIVYLEILKSTQNSEEAAGAHHAVEGEASGLAATPAVTASVRRLDMALAELAAMAATTPMATTAATPPKKGKQKVGLNNQC